MKRKFVTNLGFFLFLNLIIKPIYVFGIDRKVQNTLGPEVYGSYFSLFNAAVIFQILLDLGIENFIRREIAQHPTKVDFYLSNILFIKIIIAIPYAAVCFVLAYFMGIHGNEVPLLLLILLNQFLASMILYLRANMGGLQLFKTESVISVLDRSIMILIVGYLLLKPSTHANFKIIWFVLAQTFAYLVALLVSIYIIVFRKIDHFRIKLNPGEIIPVLQKLKPFASLVLLMAIYYRVDTLMLRILLPDGAVQSGIYAHAFRILDFMSNYALLFPLLLLPMFSKQVQSKENVGGLLEFSVLLLIVPSATIVLPAFIYRDELFQLLFNQYTVLSANVFAVLIISYFGMCISYTFGALLTANGNLRQLNFMALGAVIVSLTLNILLIPKYKVMGAATANAGAEFFTIVAQIWMAKRIFNLRVNYKTIIRFILFTSIIIVLGLFIKTLHFNWMIGAVLLFVLSMLTALLSKLFNIRSAIDIVRKEKIIPFEKAGPINDE